MKKTTSCLIYTALFLFMFVPSPALAQNHDIAIRSMALQACNVDGYGGYGSYEICVEQTYSDALNQGRYRLINYLSTEGQLVNRVPLECFGRAVAEWCELDSE